jgi:simple sugar transport system ATP-binding protein
MSAAPAPPAVRVSGLVKRFGGVPALAGVDFELRRGEIHALLGENGAGKSTLMSVLSGLYAPDAGTIEVGGRPVRFRSAGEAARAGIGMVHQHFKLVEGLTVAENLALALPAETPFLLPRRGLAAAALAVAERLGWHLEPEVPVWQLPVGVRQRLEIVKVLARDPEILILDEPTAVLAPVELEELFTVLTRLRGEGRSLVFISHKLNEVLRLCDRVTVLRRGHNAGTVSIGETDAADLARRMIGAERLPNDLPHTASPSPSASPASDDPPILRLHDLRVRDERGLDAVAGLSLELRAGEIFGVAGVDGNGQAELAEAVMGLRPLRGGSLEFAGQPSPHGASRRAVGYIPQDRRRAGVIAGMSVRDNLVLELHGEPEAGWGPWLRWNFLNAEAAQMARDHDVRAASLAQDVATLSGGNQQKIVIARALRKNPRLIVALNPTRGLDVGATAYVHDQLREQRRRGAAILLISTELEEVLALSDRVGVLYAGQLVGEVSPDTPRHTLGLLMGGKTMAEAAATIVPEAE